MSTKDSKTEQPCTLHSVKRMGVLQSATFIAEANMLCEQITAGMEGLGKAHKFETNEDLILAILRIKAKDFSPYA